MECCDKCGSPLVVTAWQPSQIGIGGYWVPSEENVGPAGKKMKIRVKRSALNLVCDFDLEIEED